MRQVDLNADLGELADGSLDAAVMPYISSANIACGAHAGNPDTMRRAVRLAKEHGVAIGAHPGYPDPENFGRTSMDFSAKALSTLVREQIETLKTIAEAEGVSVRHVKLHGALYNDLAGDYERSSAICRTIAAIDSRLRFIGLANSASLRAAEDAGLVAIHEVFADRAYADAGTLVPRSEPGAVIHDEVVSVAQVEMMVLQQKVPTAGSRIIPIQADSVCVHGDDPSAMAFVATLRNFFKQQGIAVRPAGELRFRFSPLGERALLAQLPSRISRSTHGAIRGLQLAIERERIEGVRECVPCYSELKIDFDPAILSSAALRERIGALSVNLDALKRPPPRVVEIPVCYEAPYAPDLRDVAAHTGLPEDEVVRRHSAQTYLVYMLGFAPGFGYLGGLDPSLATPRHATPRLSVPAGSVGIAGDQTGVYPLESPGGWRIIGRTPLALFTPEAENPFLLEPGDEVRFVPISAQEFESL